MVDLDEQGQISGRKRNQITPVSLIMKKIDATLKGISFWFRDSCRISIPVPRERRSISVTLPRLGNRQCLLMKLVKLKLLNMTKKQEDVLEVIDPAALMYLSGDGKRSRAKFSEAIDSVS